MELISGCRYLKLNLKAKNHIYINSTIQRFPTKLLQFFWLKIFFICHWCQRHHWSTLSCEYLCKFFEKIRNGPTGILWGWGETDSWKKPEAKNLVTLSLYIHFTSILQSFKIKPVCFTFLMPFFWYRQVRFALLMWRVKITTLILLQYSQV
jgi:hypothetical protein